MLTAFEKKKEKQNKEIEFSLPHFFHQNDDKSVRGSVHRIVLNIHFVEQLLLLLLSKFFFFFFGLIVSYMNCVWSKYKVLLSLNFVSQQDGKALIAVVGKI